MVDPMLKARNAIGSLTATVRIDPRRSYGTYRGLDASIIGERDGSQRRWIIGERERERALMPLS